MDQVLTRPITEPIREDLSWQEKWKGADNGLIFCWERGRQLRAERPAWAEAADRGELIPLWWIGGVENKLKGKKTGTLYYLATWQGLRNENLRISLSEPVRLTCSRTQQEIEYRAEMT